MICLFEVLILIFLSSLLYEEEWCGLRYVEGGYYKGFQGVKEGKKFFINECVFFEKIFKMLI